jgi:hypothetical protein
MVWSLRGGGGPECWALVSQKRGFKSLLKREKFQGSPWKNSSKEIEERGF